METVANIILIHVDNELPERIPTHLLCCIQQIFDLHERPGDNTSIDIHLILTNIRAKRAFDTKFKAPSNPAVNLHVSTLAGIPTSTTRGKYQTLARADEKPSALPLWRHALARFFIIADYVGSSPSLFKGRPLIHMENDVILYERLDSGSKFLKCLKKMYPVAAAPFDHPCRVVPSFVFFHDGLTHSKKLADSLLPLIKRMYNSPAHTEQGAPVTDMSALALLPKSILSHLPVTMPESPDSAWQHKDSFLRFDTSKDLFLLGAHTLGGVFDAAAIGQLLFGTDPRYDGKPPGFVNETAVYNCSEWTFMWEEQGGFKRLKVSPNDGGIWYDVFCLHCHSKMLDVFMSKTPAINTFEEEWYRRVLNIALL